jgi:hypothetical protein
MAHLIAVSAVAGHVLLMACPCPNPAIADTGQFFGHYAQFAMPTEAVNTVILKESMRNVPFLRCFSPGASATTSDERREAEKSSRTRQDETSSKYRAPLPRATNVARGPA